MWSAGFKVVDIKVYFLASGDDPVRENKVIWGGEENCRNKVLDKVLVIGGSREPRTWLCFLHLT